MRLFWYTLRHLGMDKSYKEKIPALEQKQSKYCQFTSDCLDRRTSSWFLSYQVYWFFCMRTVQKFTEFLDFFDPNFRKWEKPKLTRGIFWCPTEKDLWGVTSVPLTAGVILSLLVGVIFPCFPYFPIIFPVPKKLKGRFHCFRVIGEFPKVFSCEKSAL